LPEPRLDVREEADPGSHRGRHPASAREQGAVRQEAALNAQQKLLIAELHGRGQSMADIAERFEVGVATVWRAVHGG